MVHSNTPIRYIISLILVLYMPLSMVFSQKNFQNQSETSGCFVILSKEQDSGDNKQNFTKKTIPLSLTHFYDPDAKLKCHELDENLFKPINNSFHPDFYKGALWLQGEFSEKDLGHGENFHLSFGPTDFSLAEVFAYNKDTQQWDFVGNTGKWTKKTEANIPSVTPAVYFNGLIFPEESIHKIRIRIISYSGYPIKVKLISSTIFSSHEKSFIMVETITWTFFGTLIIIALVLGIFLGDDLYIISCGTTFLVFILTVISYIIGIGNLIPMGKQNPSLFSFTHLANLTSISLASAIFARIISECREKKNLSQHIILGVGISTACLLFLFVGTNPKSVYIVTNSGIILCSINLLVLWIKNLHSGRTDAYIILDWWGLNLVFTIALRVLGFFQVLLPLNAPVFDLSPFMLQNTFFILMLVPTVFLATKRYKTKIQWLNKKNKNSDSQHKETQEKLDISRRINNALLESEHSSRNILHMQWLNKSSGTTPLILGNMDKNISLLVAQSIMHTGILPPDEEESYSINDFLSYHIDLWQNSASKKNQDISLKTLGLENQSTKMDKKIFGYILNSLFFNCTNLSLDNTKISISIKLDEDSFLTYKITTLTDAKIHKHTKEILQNPSLSRGPGFELLKMVLPYYDGEFSTEDIGSGFDFSLKFKIDCAYSKVTLKGIPKLGKLSTGLNHSFWENILTIESQKPKVLLATGDQSFCNIIEPFFADQCYFYTATTGDRAWNLLSSWKSLKTDMPDIIICDLDMPVLSGIGLYRKTVSDTTMQNIPFVFMLDRFDIDQIKTVTAMGVVDCLIRPCTVERISRCIYSIFSTTHKVKKDLVNQITKTLLGEPTATKPTEIPEQTKKIPNPTATDSQTKLFQINNLSAKEMQIATLMSEGKTDKEIAEILGISAGTVATHNKRIFKKLDVHSRIELVNKVR